MPENNHHDNSAKPSKVIRRRRFINRRNMIIVAVGLACAAIALVLVGLLAYRLGFVDRYVAGQASYYEVLETQQLLFPAENSLARTHRNQLLVVVQLYKALGGGWEPEQSK